VLDRSWNGSSDDRTAVGDLAGRLDGCRMIGAGDSRLTWRTKTEENTGLSESPMLRVTLAAAHEDGGKHGQEKKDRGSAVGPRGPRGPAGETGARGPVGQRGHRGLAGTAALSAGNAPALAFMAVEEQIEGIKHELDMQLRRMVQFQEQLDQLRALVLRLTAATKLEP
jgi:hypothetical protein